MQYEKVSNYEPVRNIYKFNLYNDSHRLRGKSQMNADVMKGDSMKHKGQGGEHYKKHGEREVCELMEKEAVDIYFKNYLTHSHSEAVKMALWGACAVKHELRAGTKEGNSIEQENAKAENYRHRQKTGEWIGVGGEEKIMSEFRSMCQESLDPETYEKSLEVEQALREARQNLK